MKNLAHSASFHSRETNAPSNPKHLTAAKRLLSPETDLPMRVAARGEVHVKVIGQDVVVLHELGKWGLIGPPETNPHLSFERHGRRNWVRVPSSQGEEASACQHN